MKHTHNVKVTKLSTGSNTRARIPQSLETFKRKLLLQEKIFCHLQEVSRYLNTNNATTVSKRLSRSLMVH